MRSPAAALEAEVNSHIVETAHEKDESGAVLGSPRRLPPAPEGHQGRRIPCCRTRHGVQAGRVRTGPLAGPSTALTSSHLSGPEPASNAANSSSAQGPARHEPPRPIRGTRVDLRHPCTVCADDRREGRRAAPRAEGCRTRTGSSAQPGTKRCCPPDAGVPDASASRPRTCRRPSQ